MDGDRGDRSLDRGGGAHNRTRTDDLFLTKEVLCQLSYVGPVPSVRAGGCVVGREGIEPPQSKTADLQSAELTTCSTYPLDSAAATLGSPGDKDAAVDGYSLVEPPRGLEPLTGGLQNRCSTN